MKIKTLLFLLIFMATSASVMANAKRLPNGYKIDPTGTQMAATLAKVFHGYYKLVKNGTSCDTVQVRYVDLGDNDKFYLRVVKLADRNGNRDGIADYGELQAYFDLACEHRGE